MNSGDRHMYTHKHTAHAHACRVPNEANVCVCYASAQLHSHHIQTTDSYLKYICYEIEKNAVCVCVCMFFFFLGARNCFDMFLGALQAENRLLWRERCIAEMHSNCIYCHRLHIFFFLHANKNKFMAFTKAAKSIGKLFHFSCPFSPLPRVSTIF